MTNSTADRLLAKQPIAVILLRPYMAFPVLAAKLHCSLSRHVLLWNINYSSGHSILSQFFKERYLAGDVGDVTYRPTIT